MNDRERAELRELQESFKRPPEDRRLSCAACGYDGPFMEAHHAIGKATLKRAFLRKGEPVASAMIWDLRNRMFLCAEPAPNNCHGRHTSRFQPLPPQVLSSANWEFAREVGLAHILERDYPAEPLPRVVNLKPKLAQLFRGVGAEGDDAA